MSNNGQGFSPEWIYFFDQSRRLSGKAGGAAFRYHGARDAEVMKWAWAWPGLAPHMAQLIYDAEHHVRSGEQNGLLECLAASSGNWVQVSELGTTSFTPPLTAFEVAIVHHSVISPLGPSIVVTFSRGDGTFVVDGCLTTSPPRIVDEVTVDEFPVNRMKSDRVSAWIQSRHPAAGSASSPDDGNASDGADCGSIFQAASYPSLVTRRCPTCGFGFKSIEERDFHLHNSSCRPRDAHVDEHRLEEWTRDIATISFRVRQRHLMADRNPRIGTPIRVCVFGVPVFIMTASEWMWSRPELAAIQHGIPFHRCYRVTELPFVVFHPQRPGVPQLSACYDDAWSLADTLVLLRRQSESIRSADAIYLENQESFLQRFGDCAGVVAGPHVGLHDEALHLTILLPTAERYQVYLHRLDDNTDEFTIGYLPNVPIGVSEGKSSGWQAQEDESSGSSTSFDRGR